MHVSTHVARQAVAWRVLTSASPPIDLSHSSFNHMRTLYRSADSSGGRCVGVRDERAQQPADVPMIRDSKSGARGSMSDHYRRARWRQGSKKVFISSVVADSDDDAIRGRLGLEALRNERLADTAKPDLDHLAAFDDFEGLIAQRVAEQHA
jgi:hypothetical protein